MIFKDDILSGKVAIVTGGGTGMGKAISLEFARLGASVVIASRNPDNLNPTADQIRALGGRCLAIPTDVRHPDQVDRMVERTVEEFGQVDILANLAAGNFSVPAEDLTPNGWRTVIDIDLNGTFYCSKAAGKVMIKQGGGKILNIIGNFTNTGAAGMVHAAAAKAGIENMTKTLAKEWGKYGINVNAIAPGPIVTEGGGKAIGTEKDYVQAFERIRPVVPLQRVGRPEEIAWASVFLVSEAASFITGATLIVDGGHWFGNYYLGY